MDKEDFLEKCAAIGVDSIVPVEKDDDGFKVIFKDGSAIYVLFFQEYGESWMEYETEEHFNERWSNITTLSGEEAAEYNERVMKAMMNKYSNPNFGLLTGLLSELPNHKP